MPYELKNPWFHRPRPIDEPRARLFCFPYAGGSATLYHLWPNKVPDDVEVVAVALPGRTYRLFEQAFTRMAPLLAALERELVPLLDRPYSFFGHSMGALIAYELIHRLQANGHRQPLQLFVSGRPAPQCTATKTRIHELPLEEFIETLRNYYGTPEIIFRNPDLQDLVLPALRTDLELLETWDYVPHERLTLPISAYGGESDRGVSREHLEAWREQTTGTFEVHFLPGDHFFFHSVQADLLDLLSRKLLA